MERRKSESVQWSLDDALTAVYTDNSFSDGLNSRSSQSLALVNSDTELCGMMTTQNYDISTFQGYGSLNEFEFLKRNEGGLVSPLPVWGKQLVYYAKLQSEFS